MLHHVALEITPADVGRSVEMWEIAGFRQVDPPRALAERFVWLERTGTQIHLALVDEPVVPQVGHAAVVVPDLEAVVDRLRDAGFELAEKQAHWRARRVAVSAPAGHRVELMQAPPPAAEG